MGAVSVFIAGRRARSGEVTGSIGRGSDERMFASIRTVLSAVKQKLHRVDRVYRQERA